MPIKPTKEETTKSATVGALKVWDESMEITREHFLKFEPERKANREARKKRVAEGRY